MIRYDVRSPRADDFINHQEILDTLAYAAMHRYDAALARSILEKARANLTPAHDHGTTLTHREASVLLACEDPEVNAEIRQLARDIKQAYYGNLEGYETDERGLMTAFTFSERVPLLPLPCDQPRHSAPQAHAEGDSR